VDISYRAGFEFCKAESYFYFVRVSKGAAMFDY